jgi:hypothetical protein
MGRRKKIEFYEITPEIKKEIIDYCNGLLLLISPKFMKENNILENELLQYLFISCASIYNHTQNYRLKSQEIVELLEHKKRADHNITEIETGIAVITNIDKNDNLIFDYKKRIDNE